MKMTFKEALIAHLEGEKVEVLSRSEEYRGAIIGEESFRPFADYYRNVKYSTLLAIIDHQTPVFRIKPRTVMCNGVEVPAPESVAPTLGTTCFIPCPKRKYLMCVMFWNGDDDAVHCLKTGLVYLNREDAIARAKAMLITR